MRFSISFLQVDVLYRMLSRYEKWSKFFQQLTLGGDIGSRKGLAGWKLLKNFGSVGIYFHFKMLIGLIVNGSYLLQGVGTLNWSGIVINKLEFVDSGGRSFSL